MPSLISIILTEASYKDLLSREKSTDPGVTQRQRVLAKYGVRFVSFDRTDGMFVFSCRSSEYDKNRIVYVQRIQFSKWMEILRDARSAENMAAYAREVMANADIQVSCSCPANLYWGYAYIQTNMNPTAKQGQPENRAPNVRNPSRKGSYCKHLGLVMRTLPFHQNTLSSILKSMVSQEV
jgi:hypothetical protein